MPTLRPRIRLNRTGLDALLEGFAAAGLLTNLAMVVLAMPDLPEIIPTHFDLSGEPNSWGPRWMLWLPGGISLLVMVGLTVLSRVPHLYNYATEITPDNVPRQYRLAIRTVQSLNIALQWLFGALTWTIIRRALGLPTFMKWINPLFVVVTSAILILYLIRAHAK